jgi:hypothetical protein
LTGLKIIPFWKLVDMRLFMMNTLKNYTMTRNWIVVLTPIVKRWKDEKDIINYTIGNCNKKFNKKIVNMISTDEDEARKFKSDLLVAISNGTNFMWIRLKKK